MIPAWGSLWRVVENQAHNALNDKVAQFILLAVAQVAMVSQYYPQIVAALLVLPQLFFAPFAGWLSDRFSKKRLIVWCSMAQVILLLCIAVAFLTHSFWIATVLFFGLAFQAAIFGPAKAGIVKELVGERHLTTASGWMQMTIIMAIAGGQLIGGKAFQFYHDEVFHDHWKASAVPMLILAGVSLLPLLFAFQVKTTPSHCTEKFHRGLFTEHFTHMDDLFRNRRLWLPALGVSFFWLAATMMMLMLIDMASQVEPNAAARAGLSSEYLGLVALGVGVGSVLTSWLSENRIELGLVPLGGVAMAASCILIMAVPAGGVLFCCLLTLTGIGSAMFMVPLNAFLMDQVEPHTRGRMLAAAGLLDSLGMMVGILLQLALMKIGIGIKGQFVVLGVLCLVTAAYVLRIIPMNFIRFCVLSLVKIAYRIRVVHHDRIPETGGALLVCNHVSYIDALILSAACERPVRFTAFDEFFKYPLLATGMRMFGVVPISNRRAKDAIVALSDAIKGGDLVCIFPEGQLTRTGMMNEIRKGFELIARRAGAPVIPIWLDDLWGSIFSYERGRLFRKHPHHFPYHASVLYGKPIPAVEATTDACRTVFQQLSAEGIARRGEVKRGLVLALAHALCRHPWRTAVAEGDATQRSLRRGELFGRAMQLGRRWRKIPAERIGVLLPPGIALATVNVALVFAGKVAVNIAPEAARRPGELRALMEKERISTVVTNASRRAAQPYFPWPDHVLDVDSEWEEVDELYLLADTGAAWLLPRFALRWRMLRTNGEEGTGYISADLRFCVMSGRELLAQVEMVRGTGTLHAGDRILCGAPPASAGGMVMGFWSPLLRGMTWLPVPPGLRRVELCHYLTRQEANRAVGDAAFVKALAGTGEDHTGLRSVLLCGESPNAIAVPGTTVCPCLTSEAAGTVLTVSMPDPPGLTSTAEPQNGLRAGSAGRLLPGVALRAGENGVLICRMPFGLEVVLPAGTTVDEEGFLTLPESVS
jgi:acyl-[acyl-carrier-protein]-phospholipid O-acyltransferase/long-chain-fatty-acid--[acyl-carrier-protein] ligase